MFLRLHYYPSGKPFLINADVIAGVERNGLDDYGSVLTLTGPTSEGGRMSETVRETLDELHALLSVLPTLGKSEVQK